MRNFLRASLVGVVGLLLFTPTVQAAQTVLGNDGRLFVLRSVDHGEVEAVSEVAADDPVLVLEVQADDMTTTTIIPGTEGPATDNSAFLAYEAASDSLFVVWERRTNLIHSQIVLASYRDGAWSDSNPISDLRFSWKSYPRLAVSRDAFELPAVGEQGTRLVRRTVLHILWEEERGAGLATVYAPVVLIDGRYTGQHQRLDLDELLADELTLEGTAQGLRVHTINAPGGADVIAGFVPSGSNELVTLRISLLSGEASFMADDLRSHLIDFGARYDYSDPQELQRAGDELRSHLIDFGARMDPKLTQHVADELRSHLIDFGAKYGPEEDEVRRLADDLRSHLIDFGFRLDNRGLQENRRLAVERIEIEPQAAMDPTSEEYIASGSSQNLQIEVIARIPLPDLSQVVEEPVLLVSADGAHAMITWRLDDFLLYRETLPDQTSWSQVRRLQLGDSIPLQQAYTALYERMRLR